MVTLRAAGGTSCLVLVDDDAAVRAALSFALTSEGYRVQAYADGETVLASAPSADCYVVDDRLAGGISGLELVRRLRGDGTAAPAILITTNPEPRLVTEAQRLGVAIIEKPLIGQELSNAIAAQLRDGAPR